MRHLGSFLLSLIIAPVIWVLTGFGLTEALQPRAGSTEPDWGLLPGAGALLAAGILYALLVLPRISPLGPGLVGVAYLGLVAWATLDTAAFYRGQPEEILGVTNPLPYPAEGFAALLAVPLLATVLNSRRWRRYDRVPALYDGRPPEQATQPMPYAEHQSWQPAQQPYPPAGWPSPPPAALRPAEEETTTRLSPVDQPTEDLAGETRPLAGTPPPPAAYPPPGHSTPTARPVGPEAPPEDPDATRRL